MELRHLRAFRAVARAASFTRAAEQLHYAQSSITEQVQALEAELGCALLARGGRRLALTAAGERLLEYAEQMLALADEARHAVAEAADEPAGELVVGGLETLCATVLPPVLHAYCRRYPQVTVAVRQENRGELHAAVRAGAMDACFTYGALPRTPELEGVALFDDRLVVIVPEDHRLAGGSAVAPADVHGEEFLVTGPGCGFREMYDRSLGGGATRIAAEVGSIAALRGCVAAGMGCGLLPELAVREGGGYRVLPFTDPAFHAPVTMSWPRRWAGKPSLAAFLDVARASVTPG